MTLKYIDNLHRHAVFVCVTMSSALRFSMFVQKPGLFGATIGRALLLLAPGTKGGLPILQIH